MATLRGLVRVGQEIQRLGQTRPGETTDLVDRAEQMVFDLAQQRVTGDFADIHDLLNESFARIMHLYEAGVDVTGTPSASASSTRSHRASSVEPGDHRGSPSMESSASPLHGGEPGAVPRGPVALFTLEMSKQVTQRLMCSEAKVNRERLRSARLAEESTGTGSLAPAQADQALIYVDARPRSRRSSRGGRHAPEVARTELG